MRRSPVINGLDIWTQIRQDVGIAESLYKCSAVSHIATFGFKKFNKQTTKVKIVSVLQNN